MAFTRLQQIVDRCEDFPKKKVAVAVAQSRSVLEAMKSADEQDVATAVLIGDEAEIAAKAEEVGLDLSRHEVQHAPDPEAAASLAVRQVSQGGADVLMKGHIHTDDFLRALLDKEHGLRAGTILSHVFVLELVDQERLVLVTDGAFNVAPDLVRKAQIALNAVYLAELLGMSEPKTAVLAAVEVVNPDMPATLDAAALAQMSDRRQFTRGIIDGPFALDNAMSELAAKHKKLSGPVAGRADIMLAPDIEAGNMLAKAHVYLAGGSVAGVVVGAAAPVVLTSRADTALSKLYSIALAVHMANMKRDQKIKLGRLHY